MLHRIYLMLMLNAKLPSSQQKKNRRIHHQRNGQTDWKRCKYLGSLLDTEEDIKRRKALAIATYNKLKISWKTSQHQ